MPVTLYMLARSATLRAAPPGVVGTGGTAEEDGPVPLSIVAESTDSGSDSREPPNREEGAKARTLASVSRERRRRRLDEDARVKIEALSVSSPFAVAVLYVVGWPDWPAPAADGGFK